MAERVLFAEQTVSGFAYSSAFGCFANGVNPAPFIPEQGCSYIVNWDGEQFSRTAFTFTAPDGASCIGIGNTIMAGVDSGEPFLIVYDATNGYFYFFSTETDSSHTVSVLVQEQSGNGIILKNRDGKDVSYEGVTAIQIPNAEGGMQKYVDSDTVPKAEETTVALEFSEGDMEVVPDDGTLFSKVTIPVPENMVAENIANGVNIAGILGTCKGALIAVGNVKGNGGELTIEHNLGVMPDVVVVVGSGAPPYPAANILLYAADISVAMWKKVGTTMKRTTYSRLWPNTSNMTMEGILSNNYHLIDYAGPSPGVNSANAKTFKVGSSTYYTYAGYTYYWYAIGGLT